MKGGIGEGQIDRERRGDSGGTDGQRERRGGIGEGQIDRERRAE